MYLLQIQMFLFNLQLIELLRYLTEDISKEKKMQELQNIAKDTVDINGIGFYTLGPIRKTINDEK